MIEKFKKYIENITEISKNDIILVAASAGIDSCVLIDLLLKNDFKIAIAHCNFQLRDIESNNNQLFISEFAKRQKVPFFTTNFETKYEAEVRKVSIQMVARELRYDWFQKITKDNNFKFIATGHHQNDSIETVILNLAKGTGIAGLHGIKPLNSNIIRPLLAFTREEILEYATTHAIDWQEDSSNISTKYARNLIRHEVIPILKKINPNLENTFKQTFEKINTLEYIFDKYLENLKNESLHIINNIAYYSIEKLKNEKPYILHQLIEEFGFNYYQSSELLLLINKNNTSGKLLYSLDYQILIDRKNFILSKRETKVSQEVIINDPIFNFKIDNLSIQSEIIEIHDFKAEKHTNFIYFDFDKIKFPLKIRTWKQADKIVPFGMIGKKKVSDILIDSKISLLDKTKILVIENADNEILSIIGLKASNKFKITSETKKVYTILIK